MTRDDPLTQWYHTVDLSDHIIRARGSALYVGMAQEFLDFAILNIVLPVVTSVYNVLYRTL